VRVAPRAGAWIEIRNKLIIKDEQGSPLAQGRGLKCFPLLIIDDLGAVAPRAGAWIEMPTVSVTCLPFRSPLAQGRGLK